MSRTMVSSSSSSYNRRGSSSSSRVAREQRARALRQNPSCVPPVSVPAALRRTVNCKGGDVAMVAGEG